MLLQSLCLLLVHLLLNELLLEHHLLLGLLLLGELLRRQLLLLLGHRHCAREVYDELGPGGNSVGNPHVERLAVVGDRQDSARGRARRSGHHHHVLHRCAARLLLLLPTSH